MVCTLPSLSEQEVRFCSEINVCLPGICHPLPQPWDGRTENGRGISDPFPHFNQVFLLDISAGSIPKHCELWVMIHFKVINSLIIKIIHSWSRINYFSRKLLKSIHSRFLGLWFDPALLNISQERAFMFMFRLLPIHCIRAVPFRFQPTPHWKGTQDEFWIPIKIPAEYGSLMPILPENAKKKKIYRGTLTNKF